MCEWISEQVNELEQLERMLWDHLELPYYAYYIFDCDVFWWMLIPVAKRHIPTVKKILRLMPAQERKQYILPSLPKLGKKNKMTFKQYKQLLLFGYCLVVEDIMSRGVLFSLLVHLLLMKKPFFFLPTCKREGTKEIFFSHYGDCAYNIVYVGKMETCFQWPQFTCVPWPEYLVTTGSIPDLGF